MDIKKKGIAILGKQTLIYGIGLIINKLVSFIMLPVYTRFLSPADYGTLELLEMTIDVISMIAGLGLAGTVFKFYHEYENQKEKNEIISTVAISLIALSLITASSGIIFAGRISQLVFGQQGNSTYFKIFFVIYFLQTTTLVPLMFIRAIDKPILFVILSSIKLIIQLSLNIYFVVLLKTGLSGILYSNLIASLLMTLYLTVYMFRSVRYHFSIPKMKRLFNFGYPFIFWSFGNFTLMFSDRYFLNFFTDTSHVGIYALAQKFGFILVTFAYLPFMQVWDPKRFEIARQPDAKIIFKKVFFYLNITLLFLALIIALFIKDFLIIASDPSFLEAHKLVPIILLGHIFHVLESICNIGIFLKEKTKVYILMTITATASSLLLNYLLISNYGVYGAACAFTSVFLIRFLLVYFVSQHSYYINYEWLKIGNLFFLIALVYIFYTFLKISNLILSIGLNTLLVAILALLIYKLILDMEEKMLLKKVLVHFYPVTKQLSNP